MHTDTRTFLTHTDIHVHTCVWTRVCSHVHAFTRVYTLKHTSHSNTCTHTFKYMLAHEHAHMYTFTYAHNHT